MPDVILAFSEEEARLTLDAMPLDLPEPYRARVENHWRRINTDGRFFNGKVLTANTLHLSSSPPRIGLAVTDYAHYLFAASDPSREIDCRAAYCAAVLVTSDGYLLLGKMARHTSAPGQIQCPGGGIEIGADREIDARACCGRELEEEIGDVFRKKSLGLRPLCIKTGGQLATVGLFYGARLQCAAAEALQMFAAHQAQQEAAGEKPEFESLYPVKLDIPSLRDFFFDHRDNLVDYLRPLFIDHLEKVHATTRI